MTAGIVSVALPRVFVAAYDADVIVAFADHIHVRHFVVNINGRFAPGFRNRPMFAMVVKTNGPAHWRRGSTLQHMHKKNTRHYVLSAPGLQITEEEAIRLDSVVSPLLMKGQSLHHICINHADEIMLDERTLYNYVDMGFSQQGISICPE